LFELTAPARKQWHPAGAFFMSFIRRTYLFAEFPGSIFQFGIHLFPVDLGSSSAVKKEKRGQFIMV
jgi:hypothetical protein